MRLSEKKYAKKTDEELMLLLTKGGQSAFDELYKRYSKPLLNFFYRTLNGEREKAEDFLHDLFLKIIEKPESFDCNRKFCTWFYSLAYNMVKNEYRNTEVQRKHEENFGHLYDIKTELNLEDIDKQQFYITLQKEISKLDAEIRTLFNLRFVEEMNVKEIAEILECPEGTIKSRLFYLTKHLAKKLFIFKSELN